MLRSVDAVQAWSDANGGEDAVRRAIVQRIFGHAPEAYAFVHEWLRNQEEKRRAEAAALDREFRLREIAAAEKSAEAAEQSARAAWHAARWAGVAAVIALAALTIPFFKNI